MTKNELVGYLSSLLTIIESKEDAGQDRGGALAREYERAYAELTAMIRKEEDASKKHGSATGGADSQSAGDNPQSERRA